jgi:hypothetical protein
MSANPPEIPGYHPRLTRTGRCHPCCGKSLIRNCVGGMRCASARVSGIFFQACSFNHSDISPFRINGLRAAKTLSGIVSDLSMSRHHVTEEMRYAASEAAGVWIPKRLDQESKS